MYQDLVRHLVLSFLEVVAGSDYKIMVTVVFSLPAEIRKKIMRLVLGCHEVLLTMPKNIEREYRLQATGKVQSRSKERKKKTFKDDFRDSILMKEDKVRHIKDRRL